VRLGFVQKTGSLSVPGEKRCCISEGFGVRSRCWVEGVLGSQPLVSGSPRVWILTTGLERVFGQKRVGTFCGFGSGAGACSEGS
jgi:hypothetical protein